MISNQILQSTLDGLKAIARVELCVIDVDGKTAATTADGLEEYLPQARAFVDSPADSQEVQGNQFFKIYDEQQLEYILSNIDTENLSDDLKEKLNQSL